MMPKPISPVDGAPAGIAPAATRSSRPAMLTMPALAPDAAMLAAGRPSIKRTKPFGSKPSGDAV